MKEIKKAKNNIEQDKLTIKLILCHEGSMNAFKKKEIKFHISFINIFAQNYLFF